MGAAYHEASDDSAQMFSLHTADMQEAMEMVGHDLCRYDCDMGMKAWDVSPALHYSHAQIEVDNTWSVGVILRKPWLAADYAHAWRLLVSIEGHKEIAFVVVCYGGTLASIRQRVLVLFHSVYLGWGKHKRGIFEVITLIICRE